MITQDLHRFIYLSKNMRYLLYLPIFQPMQIIISMSMFSIQDLIMHQSSVLVIVISCIKKRGIIHHQLCLHSTTKQNYGEKAQTPIGDCQSHFHSSTITSKVLGGFYSVCHLYSNRMPLKSLNSATPYYKMYNSPDDCSHLRIFGSLFFVLIIRFIEQILIPEQMLQFFQAILVVLKDIRFTISKLIKFLFLEMLYSMNPFFGFMLFLSLPLQIFSIPFSFKNPQLVILKHCLLILTMSLSSLL